MSTRGRRREQEASWPAVDLDGLEGSYVMAPALTRRARWVWWRVGAGVMGVVIGQTIALIARGDADRLAEWTSQVVLALLCLGPFLLMVLRPPRTRLTPQALTARTEVFRKRTTPWHDVLEVRPAGRWSEHSSAVLRDGTSLELPGLSVEQAQQLARVLDLEHPHHGDPRGASGTGAATAAPRRASTARTGTTSPSTTQPPGGDLGLEGPFRSARRR